MCGTCSSAVQVGELRHTVRWLLAVSPEPLFHKQMVQASSPQKEQGGLEPFLKKKNMAVVSLIFPNCLNSFTEGEQLVMLGDKRVFVSHWVRLGELKGAALILPISCTNPKRFGVSVR